MRIRLISAVILCGAFALATAAVPGCNCSHNPGRSGDGGDTDAGIPAIGSITIAPSDVTLDLVQGQPPQSQSFTVTYHAADGDKDVTGAAMYTLNDPGIGTMNLNTFTTGTDHGGTTQLIAVYTPDGMQQQMAMATIHVRVHGAFQGPDCMNNCPAFPPDNAPTCTAMNITPNIVYPSDGVLLPPNMNVVSVQWTPFPGSPPTVQEFEVDFSNANTDVRVTTKCTTQTMDTTGVASGGCELVLDPTMWDFIAKSNRGGDAVKVTVRATTDGMCATPSMNSVNMAFAEEDLNGGIFYWKSSITAGGVGGNIWAKQFGNDIKEEQITGVAGTNLANATCFGCHTLSRDGKQMLVNFDDADSDDEYGDVVHTLMDVMSKNSLDGHTSYGHFQPGFQTFNPDHTFYLASNGDGVKMPDTNFMYLYDTSMPTTDTVIPFGPAASRPTMMDWSPDGKSILFVLPTKVAAWDGTPPQRNDDDHVFGGSIYVAPWDPMAKMAGTPTPVVMSQGENNFYPSYSPDGSFIAFDRVPLQGTTATIDACTGTSPMRSCPNDSFSNPKSRVWLMSTKQGAMPVDAENLNGSPAASPVDVSNSWPRWSPFIQMYKGDRLLWITFSSTRDYGLLVRNHQTGMFQCYPADSYEDPAAAHNQPFQPGCQQPQIWMAAVNLSHLEFNATDPSFHAFWLPFQDITKHNHTAQWAAAVVTQPQPDMGTCIAAGGDCSSAPNNCCAGVCTANGICGIP